MPRSPRLDVRRRVNHPAVLLAHPCVVVVVDQPPDSRRNGDRFMRLPLGFVDPIGSFLDIYRLAESSVKT
jgi:hypothetical protein